MTRPYVLVLTGSIGTGKSTTAAMFTELGIPVWDADAVVANLYGKNGAAVDEIAKIAPDAVIGGMVKKDLLRGAISKSPDLLKQIEAVVHPLVAADRRAFLASHEGAELVLLDIPLFFEVSGDLIPDGVLVVTIDPREQRRRVLDRGTMTEEQFDLILSRQMPDSEKRKRADFVIETQTLDQTRDAVHSLIQQLGER